MTVDTADALSDYLAESLHTGPPPIRTVVTQVGHAFWACLPAWVFDRNLPLVSQPAKQLAVLYELWALGLASPAPDDARFWRQKGSGK